MSWISSSSCWRASAGLLLFAAACSDHSSKANVDADLAHDLALSNQVAAQPTFRDTALGPAPAAALPAREPVVRRAPRQERTATPTPRREPAPPVQTSTAVVAAPASAAVAAAQIGAGTGMNLTTGGRVCTQSNRPGDKIVATVNAPVMGQNGGLIPAGSSVVLEVASVTPGTTPETSTITFRVRSVDINGISYPAAGDVAAPGGLERVAVAGQDHSVDKEKVIGGAIAGAILGHIIGKSTKGTVIGAATGAAAGAAASRMNTQYEGCLPSGSPLRLTLSDPIVLTATR